MLHSSLLSLLFCCSTLFVATQAVVIDREGLPDTGLDTTTWTTGKLPSLTDMWTANDFQIAAKNVLSGRWYSSYRTGALDETTYQNNLNVWKYIKMNGHSWRDVSGFSMETSILGYNFSAPFFIAPAANVGHANDCAERCLVTAAGKENILYVPSISATLDIEDIADAALDGQTMFHQEYFWSDRNQIVDELDRIERGGFRAIFLTIDNTGIEGIRTRSLRFTGASNQSEHASNTALDSVVGLRQLTDLPIVPKGIRNAADAKAALDAGFPAIYISNHGGRTLDGAATPLEIALDIKRNAPEVFERMEVYADGGVRRGSHILALLALGVRAVGLGRSPVYANVFGEAGVIRLIQLLKQEIETTAKLMGVNGPLADTIDESYINTRYLDYVYNGIDMGN